jgi:CRP/FNR family transcriptional regulator, cyclic AMP receptor protein
MEKKIFLVVGDPRKLPEWVSWINDIYEGSQVFVATDGAEALNKMRNVPPNFLVTELDLPRLSGMELIRTTFREKEFQGVGVVAICDMPAHEAMIDDSVRGKLKILPQPVTRQALIEAMNACHSTQKADFSMRALGVGDVLFREGESASAAYLLKRGRLEAVRERDGKTVTLGEVLPGEFVGEMAHIGGEPRSATVRATEPSELVEIPLGMLDFLLFSKPTWTKALLRTLCKRLTQANERRF